MILFDKRLKYLRESKGLTQAQLAQALNVSEISIKRWESKACQPRLKKLVMLAKFFGVRANYLLGVDDLL